MPLGIDLFDGRGATDDQRALIGPVQSHTHWNALRQADPVEGRTDIGKQVGAGPALAVLDAAGLPGVAAARQSLEATVYKNGFEKGMLVALPIGTATVDRPVVPLAQGRPQLPRAFQLRLIEFAQPRVDAAAAAPGEMAAVVENLEPGVNYTWRIAIDTAAGRMVTPSATAQARVCPADMAQSPAVPRRKP